MDLSRQAYFYLITLIIVFIINAIVTVYIYGTGVILIVAIIIIFCIPFLALAIYHINCLSKGGCEILSWILTICTIISLTGTTIFMIGLALVPAKPVTQVKSDPSELEITLTREQ